MQTFPFMTNVFAESEKPARTPSLSGDARADVVIVGGGVVGLSCALTLREAGLDVAVVERMHVGFASSGRHFGLLTPHFWNFEGDRAEVLVGWAQGCLDEIETFVAKEGIECDFRRAPFWMPIAHPDDGRDVPVLAEWYAGLGIRARFVEADQVDCTPIETYGAMVLEDQATVDPYRLIRGMRKAVLRSGVRLYEGTNVDSIQSGSEVVVKTSGGSLRAPKVVLALNGYSGQFPFLREFVAPMHTHAIATEPLDDETIDALGCVPEDIVVDFFPSDGRGQYYQRLRPDRCFYFGGGVPVEPRPGDELAADRDDEKFQSIHEEMIRRYPVLRGVGIKATWGGPIVMTATEKPIIANVPGQENLIVAITGNGMGMGLGPSAGRLVKGLVLGKDAIDAPTRAFLEACEGLP